jgi:hypothetical protein
MEQHLVDVVGLKTCHPQGLIPSTPEVSHTQQGVDNFKYADLEWSGLRIEGFETAILNNSIFTSNKENPTGSVGFFYFKLIWI